MFRAGDGLAFSHKASGTLNPILSRGVEYFVPECCIQYLNKHDNAISYEAFMELKIGQYR